MKFGKRYSNVSDHYNGMLDSTQENEMFKQECVQME